MLLKYLNNSFHPFATRLKSINILFTLSFFNKNYFGLWKKIRSSHDHFKASIYRTTVDTVFLNVGKFLSRSLGYLFCEIRKKLLDKSILYRYVNSNFAINSFKLLKFKAKKKSRQKKKKN
jgi:hypothetical protein